VTNLANLRDYAEQTLDATLPYEETWHTLATGVLALIDVAEAAHVVTTEHAADNPFLGISIEVLEQTLARFEFP
jgi:hypothetical protein